MSTTEKIMSIAQEYASAWALVGSRFDNGHGMEYAVEARAALLKAVEALAVDAARYRWLRDSHWTDNTMAVVMKPKDSVKLGYECPYGLMLNERIDTAMQKQA